jgi:hypothetical protein
MRGQCLPKNNFRATPNEVSGAEKKFIRTQAAIANQLVGSLAGSTQSDFYDAALYYSKWYDFQLRRSHLTGWKRYRRLTRTKLEAMIVLQCEAARMLFALSNLLLTKGGTSVSRLLVAFAVLNAVLFPYLALPQLCLKYADNPCYCQEAVYVERLASSVELFLAFGYTNYSPQDFRSHLIITGYTTVGVVWYAFLIPVLLRRVYK